MNQMHLIQKTPLGLQGFSELVFTSLYLIEYYYEQSV